MRRTVRYVVDCLNKIGFCCREALLHDAFLLIDNSRTVSSKAQLPYGYDLLDYSQSHKPNYLV